MKIGSFATFVHIVIQTTCMMDLFNIPLCGKNFDTCIFDYISWEIKCYIDRQAGLRGPDPCSCCLTFYSLAPFFFILPFVLIITKISSQIAMRKSIHGVTDVQFLGSRHQMTMLHYWIFYIRITAHAALRNSHTSIRHAAPSNCSYYDVLGNQYAVLNH